MHCSKGYVFLMFLIMVLLLPMPTWVLNDTEHKQMKKGLNVLNATFSLIKVSEAAEVVPTQEGTSDVTKSVHGELTFKEWFGIKDWIISMANTIKMIFRALVMEYSILVAGALILELYFVEFIGGFMVLFVKLLTLGFVDLWWLYVTLDNYCYELIFIMLEGEVIKAIKRLF